MGILAIDRKSLHTTSLATIFSSASDNDLGPESWEKVNRKVSKPGVSHFFNEGPDCVADPFGTVPRRCC